MSNALNLQYTKHGSASAKGWLILAVIAMGLSTLFAVVLVVSRIPALSDWALVDNLFRVALVLHVDFAIGLWFMSVVGMLWTRSLGDQGRSTGAVAAAVGMFLMLAGALGQSGQVLLSDYLPVLDNRLYLIGLGLFAAVWLQLAARVLLAAAVKRRPSRLPDEAGVIMPLSALLALLAAGVLVVGVINMPAGDWQASFAALVWGPGHLLQSLYTLLVLLVWIWLCELCDVKIAINSQARNVVIVLAALPALVGAIILPWFELGSQVQHTGYTLVMAAGGTIAFSAMLLGCFKARFVCTTGRYRTVLLFSLTLFTVGTGLGFFIRESSSLVPAHYHGVIGAVTLAFMGIVYHLLPAYGAEPVSEKRVLWQARLYGSGLLTLIAGLVLADIPRKVSGAQMQVEGLIGNAGVTLMGLGGVAALSGSFMFVVLALRSLMATSTSMRAGLAREAKL